MKRAENIVYLDNAATTFPKPQSVTNAVARCMRQSCGNPGRGSHRMALAAAQELYACREETAEFFGATSAEQVVFTMNTTYALNIAIKSILKNGDHVLIGSMEHNSVLRPVAALKNAGIITYDVFSAIGSETQVLTDIKRKLRSNTAAVICAHVPNTANITLPISEIGALCRARGLFFIVDGAQSAGHLPLDVSDMSIDALCVPGHKGLYGPQGIGMIVLGGERLTRGKTLIEGGSGVHSLETGMPQLLPERYEAGTLPTPAAAGLAEGIRFVRSVGINEIHEHECALWSAAYARLSEMLHIRIYDKTPGSVLLFSVDGAAPSEVGDVLNRDCICVRTGYHCAPLAHRALGSIKTGAVRASFGVYSTERDVLRLVDAVWKLRQ